MSLKPLSAGYDFKRIVAAYPTLKEEDVKAAVEYAAKIVKNEEAFSKGSLFKILRE